MWFLTVVTFLLLLCTIDATVFKRVILSQAVSQGAVCLDGSPPGYYIHYGSSESRKWIIHLEGGGWCYDKANCVERSKQDLGSSKAWPEYITLSGFLSADCLVNPQFCGWSMVFVGYCDGASFAGNMSQPINWEGSTIYFRGFRILDAVIDHFVANEWKDAEHVILTGCSAGGIGTYLHADHVRAKIPSYIPVHAVADAGYFIDAPNIAGVMEFRKVVQYVYQLQNVKDGLNQDCIVANMNEEWKCFFAQYTYPYIKTPIFLLNSAYDAYQIENTLQLGCLPPACSEAQLLELENFGLEFIEAAGPAIQSPTNGVFIDSCVVHCQSLSANTWTQYKVDGQTMGETIYAWMTGNSTSHKSKEIDCAYPCNPTCLL